MGLSAVLTAEQFAAADKAVQPFYKESEGQYVLDADVDSHPQVHGLKSALTKERDAAKKAAAALKELQAKGTATTVNDEDLTAQIGKVKTDYESKLVEMAKERDILQSRVRHLSIVEAGTRAISSARANQTVLLPHLQQVADLDEKGRLVIKGSDGKPLLKKGWSSLEDYMGLEEYISSLKDHKDWSVAFESSGASGTGGGSDQRNTKPVYTYSTTPEGNRVL
jgi:hypothetical protein